MKSELFSCTMLRNLRMYPPLGFTLHFFPLIWGAPKYYFFHLFFLFPLSFGVTYDTLNYYYYYFFGLDDYHTMSIPGSHFCDPPSNGSQKNSIHNGWPYPLYLAMVGVITIMLPSLISVYIPNTFSPFSIAL
jgi:hypothetical protein